MNKLFFACRSAIAASAFAAVAAAGCAVSDGMDDDLGDEEYGTDVAGVDAPPASLITTIGKAAAEKAGGALGGLVMTKVLGAFGIYGTSNISQQSMQKIAELVGTTVRSEFLNTYEAKLNTAYTLADQYSRTCTTPANCKASTLSTLQDKATDIINYSTEVAEYYKLPSLSKDRLTVAPQLANAFSLNTTFLVETYLLFKLQDPQGNYRPNYLSACSYASSSVGTLNEVEQQFNDYIDANVTKPKAVHAGCGKGCSYIAEWCYSAPTEGKVCAGTSPAANTKRNATIARLRSDILGDSFNAIRDELRSIGQCGMSWSQKGPIAGKHCVKINEPSEPHAWGDNYLCSTLNFGIKWSYQGKIPGMKCTQVNEPSEPAPHIWNDNYVCVPSGSVLDFQWTYNGSIAGKSCVQFYEGADPHTWNDNFLCF